MTNGVFDGIHNLGEVRQHMYGINAYYVHNFDSNSNLKRLELLLLSKNI